jgi:hypothetical protein
LNETEYFCKGSNTVLTA